MVAGCSNVGEYESSSERSSGLDFTPKNIQYGRSDEEKSLVWRTLSLPQDGNIKLDIELPFEFEECRKYGDLPEIKNMEAYIHKEDMSMIAIDYGVIVDPNK